MGCVLAVNGQTCHTLYFMMAKNVWLFVFSAGRGMKHKTFSDLICLVCWYRWSSGELCAEMRWMTVTSQKSAWAIPARWARIFPPKHLLILRFASLYFWGFLYFLQCPPNVHKMDGYTCEKDQVRSWWVLCDLALKCLKTSQLIGMHFVKNHLVCL